MSSKSIEPYFIIRYVDLSTGIFHEKEFPSLKLDNPNGNIQVLNYEAKFRMCEQKSEEIKPNSEWVKFDCDDGAEIFYKINVEDRNVDFKVIMDTLETKMFSLFFDEIEEVFQKIQQLSGGSLTQKLRD